MNKLSPLMQAVLGAVVVALLVIVIIGLQGKPVANTPQVPLANSGNVAANTIPSSTPPTNEPTGSTVKVLPAPPAKLGKIVSSVPIVPSIAFVVPTANNTWQIGTSNTISWTHPANISGDISVVDAQTQQLVGVIIPQLGPNQTSYAWNTRDVFISRTSPLKKTITPGTYLLKLSFDGNHLPVITSPVVTITN